jgi:hypothetical protein
MTSGGARMRIFVIVLSIAFIGLSASSANAECTCRNRDIDVSEGKTVCVQTPKGPQLARCEKVLNVTSWRFLGEGCLVVGVEGDQHFVRRMTTKVHGLSICRYVN